MSGKLFGYAHVSVASDTDANNLENQPAYGPRSSGRRYAIPPPQWPSFSAPLTTNCGDRRPGRGWQCAQADEYSPAREESNEGPAADDETVFLNTAVIPTG